MKPKGFMALFVCGGQSGLSMSATFAPDDEFSTRSLISPQSRLVCEKSRLKVAERICQKGIFFVDLQSCRHRKKIARRRFGVVTC
jgi:hypothetical protein